MPCCDSYWMEFQATRVPSYSPTQSPASALHAPPLPTLQMWLVTKRGHGCRLWFHQLWKQIMGIF